jgi:hypothetical protein
MFHCTLPLFYKRLKQREPDLNNEVEVPVTALLCSWFGCSKVFVLGGPQTVIFVFHDLFEFAKGRCWILVSTIPSKPYICDLERNPCGARGILTRPDTYV